MPEHSQTPASKRFLPPSSSAGPRARGPSSSYQQTPLVKHPQTASSSPHARTPFSRQPLHHDDIETSFDEQSEAISPISKTSNAHPNLSSHVIDDHAGDAVDGHVLMSNRPTTPATSHLHRHHPTRGQCDPPCSPSHDLSVPLPKRQKTVHNSITSNVPVPVSSSPSASETAFPDSDLEDVLEGHNLEDGDDDAATASIDRIVSQKDGDSDTTRTKFRLPPRSDDTPLQQSKQHVSRGIFKNLSATRDPWSETPLPSTFSPSRRKGKFDYVRGGMAETVRNWVLDLAGNQSKVNPQTNVEMITQHVTSDTSGRFELVDDDKNQPWLLVHLDEEPRGSHISLNREDRGKGTARAIAVKGTDTTWEIEGANVVSGQGDGGGDKLRVATLWHPV